MGGRPLQIYLPMLWFSLRPTDFYQVIKSSFCLAKTFKREGCNLLRRYVNFWQVDRGSDAGEGYTDFPIAEIGVCLKSREITAPTSKNTRIPRTKHEMNLCVHCINFVMF